MEHYGVPTRLLDWTDGVLVALYFALRHRGVNNDQSGESDAAVYMLDPWALNEITFRNDEREGVALADWPQAKKYLAKDELNSERLDARLPLAIDPTHLASRVAAQRSRFTLFGKELEGLKNADDESKKPLLAKIPIDGKACRKIKAELKTCGVSESTVFPDLEGLGRELRWWWTTQCPLEPQLVPTGNQLLALLRRKLQMPTQSAEKVLGKVVKSLKKAPDFRR
jgi:hypothetical protein